MNKQLTARLYINGKYIADVNLDKAHLFKNAIEQYKKDENLGRLLWKLDGTKVKERKYVVIGGDWVDINNKLNIYLTFNETIDYNKNYTEKHFLKYCGNRKNKKYPIIKKSY